ncbi:NAD(P)-dependent oxidoreductase [Sinorhizobium sp. BG8]|uniref:NAD-dependent epimerase/dehydratase family protein n=1 Tax=Sinorhizobium sp. BG8 TaxID=2613773 RepID=UPI00193D277B|nr:NAD(P)-dependent oxidoreductase [Sinorhizobium sp. BG8]
MSRVLITGGAGFIGSHLVGACLAAGDEVHVIARKETGGERLRQYGDAFVLHSFDLVSELDLKRCIAEVEPERIFHLAARPRRKPDADLGDVKDGFREQFQALLGLLAAAAQARRPPRIVIRTGSLAEYGVAPAPYLEDGREQPVNAYGAELTAAAHLVAGLQSRMPFPVVTARLALVYGAWQSTEYFLPWLIRQCLAGKPSLVRHPEDRRDLLYVDDVVEGLVRLSMAPFPVPPLINIATGIAPPMRDLARLVLKLTGADPRLITYDESGQSSGIPDFRASPELARKTLNWVASTPFEEGLVGTVDWYRARARSEETGEPAASPTSAKRETTEVR